MSPGERLRRIERARDRFRGPAFVTGLLEESRRRSPDLPSEAFEIAELARRAANRNP